MSYQIDNRGSYRATLDHNHVLKPKFLAIRYSGLYEDFNSYRTPTENFQRRHYATMTLTPFGQRTTLRLNFEQGLSKQAALRPWPAYDAVTPWIAAGRPIIPTFVNSALNNPVGTSNYGESQLVFTGLTPAGTVVPTMSFQNTEQGIAPNFNIAGFAPNAFPVHGGRRSLVDDSIYPTFVSNFGNTAMRIHDFKVYSVFFEQNITKDLDIEVAHNRFKNDLLAQHAFGGGGDFIFVDPNAQLRNGQPNPNVGMIYADNSSDRIDNPTKAETTRATVSYNLNFTRASNKWLQALGDHRIALYAEQSKSDNWISNSRLQNITPFASTGPEAQIGNAANRVRVRYYFDPAKGQVGTNAGGFFQALPTYFAGVTPPPGAGTGALNLGYFTEQGLNMFANDNKTKAIATQIFFWNRRIVVTSGRRQDDSDAWRAPPGIFNHLRDANGFAPSGEGINVRTFAPQLRRSRGGKTSTAGVVFHATSWMSLTYNTSNNLNINDSALSVSGDLLPNPKGDGKDIGAKFSLFDGKVFIEALHYTNSNVDAQDSIATGVWGNFGTPISEIWEAIATFTGDTRYLNTPYRVTGAGWSDVATTTSKGWEFAVTANPTKNWRISLNGSKRGDNTTTERGRLLKAYLAENIPFIRSHPEWLPLIRNTALGTVEGGLQSLQTTLTNFEAVRNTPSANFASSWTLNMVQSYNLGNSIGGIFKGLEIGATANARGPSIAGFANQVGTTVLDVTRPYYAPSYTNYGARISYARKIFRDRVKWSLQMNVRNVLNKDNIAPLFIVDSRDGNGTPNTPIFHLREPRTYQFTSTFAF